MPAALVSHRGRPTGPARAAGFTLVEVLVASLILALALLALSSLFAVGLKNNAISKEDTVMAALAQDKLEQIKRLSRDQLESEFDCTCRCAASAGCTPGAACGATCYPTSGCAAANQIARRQENPIPDPNPIDEVRERLYVREWELRKVTLGEPVGCVYKITVTVGSRNGLLAPRPTSASTWVGANADEVLGRTNPRRVVLATYRR